MIFVYDIYFCFSGSIKNIFDPAYLEADAQYVLCNIVSAIRYIGNFVFSFMFEKLMEYLKENYNYNDYFMSSLESLGTSKTTVSLLLNINI